MVDFDNETTIGTPAADVQRISILQRRYDLIEAFEMYKKATYQNANTGSAIVRARLLSLFLELQATLKRRWDNKKYEKIKNLIFEKKVEEEKLIEIIFEINEELDKIQLTKIDTKKVYDSGKVEEENRMKGY